mgnify:CR=1 FL=1
MSSAESVKVTNLLVALVAPLFIFMEMFEGGLPSEITALPPPPPEGADGGGGGGGIPAPGVNVRAFEAEIS